MNNIGYIYKITNPNGFIYIGKTKNYKNRFNQYKNLNCKSQPALYNSFIKYGFENHTIEIIETCNLNILSDREVYYIELFNSHKKGLNCTVGGDGGFMYGDMNFSKRPEVREKMSKAKLEFYKNNEHPRQGKSHTDEVKLRIKEKRALQKIIRYIVIDLDTEKEYTSIKELAEELNIKYKAFFYQLRYTKKYELKYNLIKQC
jgi:group I intron endonuclease